MSQQRCNGGVHSGGQWLFCTLVKNHQGECYLLADPPAMPVSREDAELADAHVESTLTGLDKQGKE